MTMVRAVLVALSLVGSSACPFLASMNANLAHASGPKRARRLTAMDGYDVDAVKTAIKAVLKGTEDAKDNADGGETWFKDDAGGHYGPNMIRLAWHCAGTYRTSDGAGGCEGARIRFSPEKDWGDNKGLIEKDDEGRGATLEVLQPIKDKYGDALSWSDLIVLAGNAAIEDMGGPTVGFCPGAADDADGTDSTTLDEDQQMIYVDAGNATAADIRKAFKKMDFNDEETIALIAGGHTFGRCHKGRSGFDGVWTATPSKWSNSYINNLLDKDWKETPIGANKQFEADGLMMLVADIALKADVDYLAILNKYKTDGDKLRTDFGKAWTKLMRGRRDDVCKEKTSSFSYDSKAVKDEIKKVINGTTDANENADGGEKYFKDSAGGNYGPNMIRFAWHCTGTYRKTDGLGGCDGARIRFPPENAWGDNAGLIMADGDGRGATISVLEPVKAKFGTSLSWADLIVLSGDAAIESMGGPEVVFCGGRKDEDNGADSAALNEMGMIYVDAGKATAADIRAAFAKMEMDDEETVALIAGGHTFGRCHAGRSGFTGAWTETPSAWSNKYVENLLTKNWVKATNVKGNKQFGVDGKVDGPTDLMMLVADMALLDDANYKKILQDYQKDNAKLRAKFSTTWTKLMNGGRAHVCTGPGGAPSPSESPGMSMSGTTGLLDKTFGIAILLGLFAFVR